jgi:integrase
MVAMTSPELSDSLPLATSDECISIPGGSRATTDRWWATLNRYRSLLSLIYRLAIRDGKVQDNPVRQVRRRKENNIRVRFLQADEEAVLRAKIRELAPEREPEFDLSLHTGMRRNEQYRLCWDRVNLDGGIITIRDSKNGESRHVPVNSEARRALERLFTQVDGSGYVVPGKAANHKRDWQRWFEEAAKQAGIIDFAGITSDIPLQAG